MAGIERFRPFAIGHRDTPAHWLVDILGVVLATGEQTGGNSSVVALPRLATTRQAGDPIEIGRAIQPPSGPFIIIVQRTVRDLRQRFGPGEGESSRRVSGSMDDVRPAGTVEDVATLEGQGLFDRESAELAVPDAAYQHRCRVRPPEPGDRPYHGSRGR